MSWYRRKHLPPRGKSILRKASLTAIAIVLLLSVGTARAQRYIDNGDGTISDTKTGLMWEQKTGTLEPQNEESPNRFCRRANQPECSDVHNVNNRYRWSSSEGKRINGEPDGSAFKLFLFTLNDETSADGVAITGCFAGHCDWRLPSIDELTGILDATSPGNLDPIFGPNQPGSAYWSHTSGVSPLFGDAAWAVVFQDGPKGSLEFAKHGFLFVRAVRGPD